MPAIYLTDMPKPWKMMVVKGEKLRQISSLSIYEPWMKTASHFIVVFLDKSCSYHYVKDVQSCGALMQNIMLAAYSLNIGSCWIGEILASEEKVKRFLGVKEEHFELMGIVTLGYPDGEDSISSRKAFEDFMI